MQPPVDASALEHAWTSLVLRAEARIRSTRARSGFVYGALAAVPVAALAAGSAAFDLHPPLSLAILAAGVAAPVFGWVVGRLRPLSASVVHARIDHQFGLADEALAARELAARTSPSWRAAILRQAVAHTTVADWNSAWPLRWPRRTGFAAVSAILAVLLAVFLLPRSTPAGPDHAAAFRAEQQSALADLTKDWEKTAETLEGEEWNAFRATIAELQSKLAGQNLSERELLVALARVESRLSDATASLSEAGVSTHAEELADALAGIEGMEAAAQALKDHNLSAAATALDKAAAALSAEDAKLAFKDGTGAESAKRLDTLAQKAARQGDTRLADTVKKMREATEARDCQSLGKCSSSLAHQSREAASSAAARSALASVARSLSEARVALAEGKKPGDNSNAFQLAMQSRTAGQGASSRSGQGNGIGDAAGDHSLGEENPLAATARQESLSGAANADGESTRRTVRTSEAAPALARAATEAELAEFTRLSREAIEDESIPLEHRRAIHRYFQLIRPNQESSAPASITP